MGVKSTLYRSMYIGPFGYVVYRFDPEHRCSLEDLALTHKQAVFVDEVAAIDYCVYRNKLVDKNGTDALI